jgi:GT2 family glycosyltransferase
MPFFSVIIPTYNRSDLLREALQSVFAQEYSDYEVIVVDDGSTEEIAAVTREFGKQVKYLRQDNRGPGAARNLGIANATADYIGFLDSDDLWFPWTLHAYRKAIDECANPSLIAGCLWQFDDEGELALQKETALRFEQFPDYLSAIRRGFYVGAGQMVVRRDAINAVGGFIEDRVNAEDHDLALRLGTRPGFVHIHSPTMIAYRQHADSATTDISKTLAGIRRLLAEEIGQKYPGGVERQSERRQIITRHLRPLSLALLADGRRADAWDLFRTSLGWHVRERRWRYVFGFPLRAAFSSQRTEVRAKTNGNER